MKTTHRILAIACLASLGLAAHAEFAPLVSVTAIRGTTRGTINAIRFPDQRTYIADSRPDGQILYEIVADSPLQASQVNRMEITIAGCKKFASSMFLNMLNVSTGQWERVSTIFVPTGRHIGQFTMRIHNPARFFLPSATTFACASRAPSIRSSRSTI